MKYLIAGLIMLASPILAHEMTPTYPQFKSSYIEGIDVVTMTLFNKRADVKHYEIQVFDNNWNGMPFAANSRIIVVNYLQLQRFDIYIKQEMTEQVGYICTLSRIVKSNSDRTAIASRICSKVK